MARDLLKDLEEWGEWPAAWRPNPGDSIVGKVLRYSVGTTAYGEARTCILLADSGERVSIWLTSTVLLDLFRREKPKVGERLAIRYIGKHETKGYKKFGLVVDRAEQEPDFSALGGEQGDGLDDEPAPVSTAPRAAPRPTNRSSTPYAAATLRPPAVRSAVSPYRDAPPLSDDDGPFNF